MNHKHLIAEQSTSTNLTVHLFGKNQPKRDLIHKHFVAEQSTSTNLTVHRVGKNRPKRYFLNSSPGTESDPENELVLDKSKCGSLQLLPEVKRTQLTLKLSFYDLVPSADPQPDVSASSPS